MRILLESILIAILATPIGMPWLAIPFALVRIIVGKAETKANEIVAEGGGSKGSLFGAIVTILVVAVPGFLLLLALMGVGMGL